MICELIAAGVTLRILETEDGMPSMTTIMRWARDNSEFREQYARAMEQRAEFTCLHERFQKPWRDTIRHVRLICGRAPTLVDSICGRAPTLVDSTGVGDPIVEELQADTGGEEFSNFQGYKFSSSSKQMLMEGLAVAIQQSEIYYPAGVIVSELECFEYEYTRTGVRYAAPEGMHDDCVMSLALANRARTVRGAEPQVIVL